MLSTPGRQKQMLYRAILVVTVCHFGVSCEPNPFVHVVTGVYNVKRGGITAYENTIPVSFRIELPNPSPLLDQPQCKAAGYLCQLTNTTFQSYKMLKKEVVDRFPYIGKPNNVTDGIDKRGLFDFYGRWQKFLTGRQNLKYRFIEFLYSVIKVKAYT
jgi:hypothetical protein